jgi:hypothetical protein
MSRTSNTSRDIGKLHELMKSMMTGIANLPPGVTSLTVQNKTYTLDEIKAQVTAFEAVFADAEQAELDYHLAIDARQEVEPDATKFMSDLKSAVKAGLGKRSPNLTVVGVTPDKTPTPLTAEQQVVKVDRAAATRAARRTVGPRAKAKIKGQLPPAGSPPAT